MVVVDSRIDRLELDAARLERQRSRTAHCDESAPEKVRLRITSTSTVISTVISTVMSSARPSLSEKERPLLFKRLACEYSSMLALLLVPTSLPPVHRVKRSLTNVHACVCH